MGGGRRCGRVWKREGGFAIVDKIIGGRGRKGRRRENIAGGEWARRAGLRNLLMDSLSPPSSLSLFPPPRSLSVPPRPNSPSAGTHPGLPSHPSYERPRLIPLRLSLSLSIPLFLYRTIGDVRAHAQSFGILRILVAFFFPTCCTQDWSIHCGSVSVYTQGVEKLRVQTLGLRGEDSKTERWNISFLCKLGDRAFSPSFANLVSMGKLNDRFGSDEFHEEAVLCRNSYGPLMKVDTA